MVVRVDVGVVSPEIFKLLKLLTNPVEQSATGEDS